MSDAETRLKDLGLTLPEPMSPVATYAPYIVTGSLVFVSGQISINGEGELTTGKVGADLSIEEGQAAAKLCALNLIAQVKDACGGDLSRVKRVVKLGGFVNCGLDFADQPKVINGASDLMVAVFDDAGRQARAAVGTPSLPFNVAVEVDAIFEID
ncbi:MAG: RidA family protein [Pseudomonadota bacterium]